MILTVVEMNKIGDEIPEKMKYPLMLHQLLLHRVATSSVWVVAPVVAAMLVGRPIHMRVRPQCLERYRRSLTGR